MLVWPKDVRAPTSRQLPTTQQNYLKQDLTPLPLIDSIDHYSWSPASDKLGPGEEFEP